ncbi:hypothetical protein BDQ17DRAFT_770642 [Cyathus striatus]|nr:hypothetical protein BDQ17DRAFT_770642 [Cyathus striatus]
MRRRCPAPQTTHHHLAMVSYPDCHVRKTPFPSPEPRLHCNHLSRSTRSHMSPTHLKYPPLRPRLPLSTSVFPHSIDVSVSTSTTSSFRCKLVLCHTTAHVEVLHITGFRFRDNHILLPRNRHHHLPPPTSLLPESDTTITTLSFVASTPQVYHSITMAFGFVFNYIWLKRSPAGYDMSMSADSAGLLARERLGGLVLALLDVCGVRSSFLK